MRIIAIIIGLILFLVFILPDNALAGTRVTVYIAGGFVVGGFALFYNIFIGSGSHSSKKQTNPEYSEGNLSDTYVYNYHSDYYAENDLDQDGMVKVFEW